MALTFQLIKHMTNNFSDDQRIGSGGYGELYKGHGLYNGTTIAVKKLYVMHGIDDIEVAKEFAELMKFKHPNIIQLIGYCYETQRRHFERGFLGLQVSWFTERTMCFVYTEGGSLAKYISDESCGFDWPTRFKIIKGICAGLNHLHNGRPNDPVYHLNLKPNNILLDGKMMPILTDFGMSKLLASSKTLVAMKGTEGYIPPELIDSGKITDKYDVFSAGVIIIKIIAGPEGYKNCCEMSATQHFIEDVHGKWKKMLQIMSKQENTYIIDILAVQRCIEIGVRCVEVDPAGRPSIMEVVDELNKLDAELKKLLLTGQPADLLPWPKIVPKSTVANMLKTVTAEPENTLSIQLLMYHRAITARSELEHILFDESAEPKPVPLLLLHDITGGFSPCNQIGQGGFATVYKGMLCNGMIAVKKLSKVVIDEKKFTEEIRCLMKAKHKNIVRFLGYCSDTQGEMVVYDGKHVLGDKRERLLCFEYLTNGTLHKQITDASCGLQWSKRYQIISGVCDGLYHLHQMLIVHLDLKPENILLDDNMRPKIADFGISRCFDEKQSRATASRMMGTMGYMAPEIFRDGDITLKSDIYSLGIIITEILTGNKSDPSNENVRQVCSNIKAWFSKLS